MLRRFAGVTIIAVFLGSLAIAPAIASRPAAATISLASSGSSATSATKAGDQVSFAVDPTRVKDRDLYSLWVANECWQGGVRVYVQYLPVQYPDYRQGVTKDFTLSSSGWTGGAADCEAYVWMFPDSGTPLPGATMTYSVSG
jgi:hypothetical protein